MRKRFNRNAVASSNGNYVRRAHQRMLKENHDENQNVLINISLRIPPKYFVKCWGKLIEVTAREAAMLQRTGNVVIK